MARQRLGRGLRERAAGADADDAFVGLDQIAGARQQEHRPVSATISIASSRRSARSVRQSFASSTAERSRLPRILFELRLEAREQRERIGGRSREADQHLVVVQATNLARALLDDGRAERDLAVAGEHRAIVATNGQDGGGVEASTSMPCSLSRGQCNADTGGLRRTRTLRCSRLPIVRGALEDSMTCIHPCGAMAPALGVGFPALSRARFAIPESDSRRASRSASRPRRSTVSAPGRR